MIKFIHDSLAEVVDAVHESSLLTIGSLFTTSRTSSRLMSVVTDKYIKLQPAANCR